MYHYLRDFLFRINPETSHELSLDFLGAAERLKFLGLFTEEIPANPVQVMGLSFNNPVGLAAGLDKNGDYFNALGTFGFGFIEIGTVTPRPQPGNPLPRMFRIPEAQAIINRMGFNNKGVAHLVDQVKKRRYKGILGINIGKNAATSVENAAADYLTCLRAVYPYADYVAVNISSPNTPGLRDLQFGDSLNRLLEKIKKEQRVLSETYQKHVPIAVKIAPDMDDAAIAQVAGVLIEQGMEGVIATNTTIGREGVEHYLLSAEAGGLSGLPVRSKSTLVIQTLNSYLGGKLPIIGVGGILDGASAADKIRAGASLVQIYSGFIYEGPGLIGRAAESIAVYQKSL